MKDQTFVVHKAIKLKVPMVPNFLIDEDGKKYAVSEFSDDQLKAVSIEWMQALQANAARQRSNQKTEP